MAESRYHKAGVRLIKRWEGFISTPKIDKGGPLVIGYGHQSWYPPKVEPGMVWTEEYASEVLESDLTQCLKFLNAWRKVELNDHQVIACLSLIMNKGPTTFRKTGVLKWMNDVNDEYHWVEAACAFAPPYPDPFPKLNEAPDQSLGKDDQGKWRERPYLGLTARRITEGALFGKGMMVWGNEEGIVP